MNHVIAYSNRMMNWIVRRRWFMKIYLEIQLYQIIFEGFTVYSVLYNIGKNLKVWQSKPFKIIVGLMKVLPFHAKYQA